MSTPLRLGSAVSAFTIAVALGGCATSGGNAALAGSGSHGSNAAYATRAQAALEAKDYAAAIDLAERAVDRSSDDAALRALLGNAYFAAGRFASAEAAYRDSLTLLALQPQVALKLALVQIAQGKSGAARSVLESARPILDPSDYGLAVALAGSAADAVSVLDQAARQPGADARVRQNLALALALAGDWAGARAVAAQDVPADQLEARIQQWMAFVSPTKASDQVASLLGVVPAVSDPGQPTRLALGGEPRRPAVPQIAPPPVQSAQLESPAPAISPPAAPPPVEVAQLAPLAPVAAPDVAPMIIDPAPSPVAQAAPEPRFVAPAPKSSVTAKLPAPKKAAARAAAPARDGKAVVQLGAYSSPERVAIAWAELAKKYPALRDYEPRKARYDGPRGTVWRLSIAGFESEGAAIRRCEQLQSRGGKCFVRDFAGDAPVRLAAR